MKRWVWIGVGISLFFMLTGAGVVAYGYFSLKHTANRMYVPLPPSKLPYKSTDSQVTAQKTAGIGSISSFSVLLLGVDQRPGDQGRSDTILILTVNPETQKVLMFNIPRDTRTTIVDRHTQDKINHAYAFNGVPGALDTIENFLDMPIDYYVEVNMEGFKTIVDTLNGVNVNNPFSFTVDDTVFPAGEQHLNGELALKFARMRLDDPRGDFGRNDRQKQIVSDLLHRASQWNNVIDFPSILKTVQGKVKTNLTFGEMETLVSKYRKKIGTIESAFIAGKGTTIGGVYYYIVSPEEKERIHNLMKMSLMATPQVEKPPTGKLAVGGS